MRSTVLALAAGLAAAAALSAAAPSAAQDTAASCRDEIARLESAFVQEREGPGSEAERVEIPSPSRDSVSRDMAKSGGVVSPSTIGSGVRTEQPPRGAEPMPMNRNAGQQPGARVGAGLSPDQRRHMAELLREGRTAADRGDIGTCQDRVREARQLVRGPGPGVGASPQGGG